MWRFLRNRRLISRLHYYLGAHILGAWRGGPCDSTALVANTALCTASYADLEPLRADHESSLISPNPLEIE